MLLAGFGGINVKIWISIEVDIALILPPANRSLFPDWAIKVPAQLPDPDKNR